MEICVIVSNLFKAGYKLEIHIVLWKLFKCSKIALAVLDCLALLCSVVICLCLIVWNTVFFLDLSILLKTSLWPYAQYRHIKVVAVFFAEEEIGTSHVSFSTKYSRVLTIQNLKAFKNIVEDGENDG